MLFAVLTSFISGIVFILLVELILIYQWWIRKPKEDLSHQVIRSKVKNPEDLQKFFKKLSELPEEDIRERLRTPETCVCLNVIFAFLWKEWRDSLEMKRIFVTKLTREFNDLIGSKAAKGIIEEINVKSYSLGESLPIIKDAALINIKSQSAEDVPDEIDIALNITYSGGFYVSADFALALSKSVYLSIKVVKISGKVKLSFRRHPTSRWSFSFYEEPEPTIELDVESRLDGKNFQQLNTLIVRHFKKVIRKKYILPNYIILYKPFLRAKIPQDEQNGLYVHNSQVTVGSVAVQVIGCSRLPLKKKNIGNSWVFCSLTVDSIPFAERRNDDPSLWPITECEVVRSNERKIGLTFREVSCNDGDNNQKKIVIDSIDQETPVGYSSLKEGDIILEINGMPVGDAKQVSKLIRGSGRRLSIMVKRPPSYMPITKTRELSRNIDVGTASLTEENASSEIDDADAFQDELINIVMPLIQNGPDDNNSFNGKGDDTLSTASLLLSKNEHEKKSGRSNAEVSQSNAFILEKTQQKNGDSEETFGDDYEKASNHSGKKTKTVRSCKNPQWNETFELRVEEEHKYINLLVWYRIRIESAKEDDNTEQQTKDILLGYVTIPLTDIAVHCLETGDRYHQQEYVLVSTAYDKVLASLSHLSGHPGLNRVACGGDITLAFTYKPSFGNDEESSVKTKVLTSEKIDKELSGSSDHLEILNLEVTKHNFGDTQFYYPTKCDFCTKKIWTKSAYQCCICGMPCHKKCLQRAKTYTRCYRNSQHSESASKQDETDSNLDKTQLDVKTLKDHGTRPSEISQLTSMKDASSTAKKIEMIGKELYSELPAKTRKMKFDEMINSLQKEIDEENETRIKLYAMKKLSKPPYPHSRIDQQITKSEQKSESLKFLMLQYCSGLESCETDI
ncbi:PDZ domain-containing protein 8-like [Dendronephthya gigantea]|uniref:PDZ domain-containing protein 8-like n=1 Tax=Dendronephthya gigantea TaxID=151771 RepID=UPI00106A43E0|nr:PDZ domain-containing protein 8-like [Dendronephthya gigantea]